MATGVLIGHHTLIKAIEAWGDPVVINVADPHLCAAYVMHDVSESVRIVTDRSTYARMVDVEYLSWGLAQRQGDMLEVAVTDDVQSPMVAVGPRGLIGFVDIGFQIGGIVTDEAEPLRTTVAQYLDHLATRAESAIVTGPSLTAVADEFAGRFGAAAADQYLDCLSGIWTDQLADEAIDAKRVATLVAADHEGLLADLGSWGRALGIATQADFSRIKQELVEASLVTVTNESRGVGRPRQRLGLNRAALEAIDDDRINPVIPWLRG